MKPPKYVTTIAMWILMLGILAYFAVYVVNYFFGNVQTELLYTYTAEETVSISGYLFRDEEPIVSTDELVEVTVAEGARVAAGGELALVYDSQESMENHEALVALEEELSALAYIRSHSSDDADESQLGSQISDAIVALRTQVSRQNLSDLSDSTAILKQLIYRQDYTYNGNEALENEIAQLQSEIRAMSRQESDNVSTITSEHSGIFSSLVDGYEAVLTVEALEGLTPSGLEELVSQQEEVDEDAYLGKLIYGNTWYYAATMSQSTADELTLNGSATLRFTSVGDMTCTVESVSDPEDGQVVVVFSSDQYLSEVTLLRDQTVELVLDTVTGYRVPTSAIRVENTSGITGVYRLYGAQANWVEVDILYTGEDYYLIEQTTVYDDEGNAVELTTLQEARRLRDGAEIITKGTDIYDGKVIS
ncbi:MAG: hypothetical protein LUF28_02680 [Clostridiales bacterium]|nr:hypothetical protein [Clostridiales bacterium]